jgi:choline-sulfatase
VAIGGVSKIPEQDHFESFVARESIRFLKNFGRDRPFLLITSFLKPHDPFMPAVRFANMFNPDEMRLPDSWDKVDLQKVPKEVRDSIAHNAPTPELVVPYAARRRIAYYYASLAQMDDRAGAVLRALKDLGLEDDTIVLYTSDHGEMLGEHGMWQKFEFYEGSCGVPLTIRAPGVTTTNVSGPAVCDEPVSLVSVLPTIAELAGVPVTSPVDETSLVPQLRNPRAARNRPVFAEYNLHTPGAKYMIRDGRYKFTYWAHDIPELYDLEKDQEELNNLALDTSHATVVERLKQKLFAWHEPRGPEVACLASSPSSPPC